MDRLRKALDEYAAVLAALGMSATSAIKPGADAWSEAMFDEQTLGKLADGCGGRVEVGVTTGYAFPRLRLSIGPLEVTASAGMRRPALAERRAELERVSAELAAATEREGGGGRAA